MASRKLALATTLALALLPPGVATVAANDSGPQPARAAQVQDGVAIVGPDVLQFRPTSEKQAMAFDQLLSFALEHADDFGYPRSDGDGFELPVVDPTGASLAAEAKSTGKFPIGYAVAPVDTHVSISRISQVQDELTGLNVEGIVGADLIWKTEPDQINGRVIVTVSAGNSSLFAALAERYGDLVAARVETPRGMAGTSSRDSDSPPFWGGAYWSSSTGKACTTGFAWTVGSTSAMLTAAHCISTGGSASYPTYANVGTVASASEENWSDTNGTQYYTGQSVSRGDVALIRYTTRASDPYIYDGAAGTSTHTGVARMTTRRREVGDSVCVNGVTTGGWCGAVTQVGADILYLADGTNVWARHVDEADAVGWTCPTHGDSGAPVFVNRSDGNVDAAGILSGSMPAGIACGAFFTDIWDPYTALPGVIKHV